MHTDTEPDGTPWRFRASLTPRRTYSGNSSIVYKRKKHYFELKDVERITSNYTRKPLLEKEELFSLQLLLQKLTIWMMERLFAFLGMQQFASQIYYFLINILDKVFSFLPVPNSATKVREGLREMQKEVSDYINPYGGY